MAGVLAMAAWPRLHKAPQLDVHRIVDGIDLTAQLQPAAVAVAREQGYRTLVDLRPDGEAPDQPSSSEMRRAAQRAGMRFHYVPVPHGDIPPAAIEALRNALDPHDGNVLLYCRSGARAARSWALFEASRPGGRSAEEILTAVRQAGQNADDLRSRIDSLIRGRDTSKAMA